MREFVCLSLLIACTWLLTCGPLAHTNASPPTVASVAESRSAKIADTNDWRHTTRGWERRSNWTMGRARVAAVASPPAPHPLVAAALILLLSIAALVGLSPTPRGRRAPVFVASGR